MVDVTGGSVTRTRRQFYRERLAQLETENAALKAQLAQRDARIAELEQQAAELLAQVNTLSEQVATLTLQNQKLTEQVAKLSKNSSNSSKPPSSDIVKPPRGNPTSGPRRAGGQNGHAGTHRCPFSEDQLDEIYEQVPSRCSCGTDLTGEPRLPPRICQQVEWPARPVIRSEYRCYGVRCPICDRIVYADWPEGVIEGRLFGPRLLALIGYMKGALHTTYGGLQEFCREILAIDVSRGHLGNALARISETLAEPYRELGTHVPTEPVLHIDESGWKDRGLKYWIWIFATSAISFFVIARSRSSKVLHEILGKAYAGTIVSDFYSVYVSYANPLQQFCLAHLIRDVKFLTTLADPAEKAFGTALLKQFKWLFRFWHQRQKIPKERFEPLMKKIRDRIFALADREELPPNSERLAKRLRKHDGALFRFLFDADVSPTNNLAERSIRHSVINQRLTQGSRSAWGRQWNERIFTVIGSCRKQNRSAWQFIVDAIAAHYFHTPTPSLIPQPH